MCNIIERVQRRFTKRIKGYASLTYKQQLTELNLDALHYLHFYHNMLLVYKSLKGYMNITPSSIGLELSQLQSSE